MLNNEDVEKICSPFEIAPDGGKTWTYQEGDRYVVTGTDRKGRRFKLEFDSWFHARCINAWRGNYWPVRDNRRHLIQSVYN